MRPDKPMIFTVPILIAPFDEDCGFIEGCASGNKAPISGCDIQQGGGGGGGGGCDTGLAIGATIVGGVVGGIFTVAIAS